MIFIKLATIEETTTATIIINRSLRRFVNSMNSPATVTTYLNSLKLYMQYFDIKEPDHLLQIDSKKTFEMIEDFIEYLRKKQQRSLSRITSYLSALRLFYSVNDYNDLNWYTLNRFKGKERKRMVDDRCYTRQEIHKLLEHADLRMKVAILVMASSGVRVGGLALLKIGDLHYIEEYRLYKIHVYSDEDIGDKYYTFCTPECASIINTYLETRKRHDGEVITKDSPLLRKDFVLAINPFLNPHGIQERIRVITLQAGIRKTRHIKKGIDDPVEFRRQRTEIMNCHGLRKFFDTICIDSDMKHIPKEIMMGHKKQQGLDRNYYRPSSDKLLNEYLKVVNELTIHDENRLKLENQELKTKLDTEFSDILSEIRNIKEQMALSSSSKKMKR